MYEVSIWLENVSDSVFQRPYWFIGERTRSKEDFSMRMYQDEVKVITSSHSCYILDSCFWSATVITTNLFMKTILVSAHLSVN